MAQETQTEPPKSGARRPPSEGQQINVQAVEAAIAEGLAKIPVVGKVLCSNECTTFEVTIVHNSPNNGAAVCLIVNRMIEIEDQLISSGAAPDDIYLKRMILDESDDCQYGDWGEKILFERGSG